MKSVWPALIAALAVSGCVAAVVGQGGGPADAGRPAADAAADERIATGVRRRLAAEPGVSGAAIEVRVRGAVVTLRGQVAGAAQRAQAERAARSVQGVKAVVSELEVR